MAQNDNRKSVVLLSAYIVNKFVIRKYRKQCVELDKNKYDVLILFNINEEQEWHVPEDVACFSTTCESLNALTLVSLHNKMK